MTKVDNRNWVVMAGNLLNTVKGGGLELFGPFTEDEANRVRIYMTPHNHICLAVELLRFPTEEAP